MTGSDLAPHELVAGRLAAAGIAIIVGHDAANVADAEIVAISTAVPPDNPEVVAATARDLPVVRRGELLAAMCATRPAIAVAGTHGKTTTSSMLAVALRGADLDPSFIVGGDVAQLGGSAHWGSRRRTSWSRPTRATAPSSPSRGPPRSSPTSSRTTSSTTAASGRCSMRSVVSCTRPTVRS